MCAQSVLLAITPWLLERQARSRARNVRRVRMQISQDQLSALDAGQVSLLAFWRDACYCGVDALLRFGVMRAIVGLTLSCVLA